LNTPLPLFPFHFVVKPVKLMKVVLNKMPTGESDKMEDLNERIESFNRELKQGYL
jgi:hypothetical protein